MARGMAFRKDCAECGHSFLAPDRGTKFCPKCTARIKEREEQAKRAAKRRPPKISPPPRPVPRQSATPPSMTEELKQQILEEAKIYKDRQDLPQKRIHGEIARKFRIKKILVAQALQGVAGVRVLTAEEADEVVRRYRAYVDRLERPPKGRRKTIAQELGLPYRSVVMAVRQWKRSQPPLKELTREQRFFVEKSYFRLLDSGWPVREVVEEIVRATGFNPWQVSRYLDLLHDGEERLKKVPDVSAGEREAILAAYFDYLSAPSPPAPFLHNLLAEKTGATPQQVHKLLLTYRLDRLREIQAPGPGGMDHP